MSTVDQAAVTRVKDPDSVAADHEQLKAMLVRPYMRSAPAEFSPRALLATLRATRVGAALLERCPHAYARFE